jgi:hypothetical protein
MRYYCTYCDYYSRDHFTGKFVGGDVFIGTKKQVVDHADAHPIGDPQDMALPVSQRAEYVA